MARPTIRDVAELAGVSTATVSYVLNGTGSVSPHTAERVRDCVKQLGYKANSLAVAHRTGRSRTIGLAVPDLTNPFFPEFAQGVHKAASASGYGVFLLDGRNDTAVEIEGVERLANQVPEGMIWCPVGEDILAGTDFGFPTVVFDREIVGFDSVKADIRHGGELQALTLMEAGHRKAGLLTGSMLLDTSIFRRDGFVDSLSADVELLWEFEADHNGAIPDEIVDQIVHSDVTCIATHNDLQAIRLLSIFANAGVSVPDEVSIIGFDDIELAQLVTPPLTTVGLSARGLGERAFEVLIDRIKNPDSPIVHSQRPVEMVHRKSLRKLNS